MLGAFLNIKCEKSKFTTAWKLRLGGGGTGKVRPGPDKCV